MRVEMHVNFTIINSLDNLARKSAAKINAINLQNQDCAVHHLPAISTMSPVGAAKNSFMADAKETIITLRQSKSVRWNAINQVSKTPLSIICNLQLQTGSN